MNILKKKYKQALKTITAVTIASTIIMSNSYADYPFKIAVTINEANQYIDKYNEEITDDIFAVYLQGNQVKKEAKELMERQQKNNEKPQYLERINENNKITYREIDEETALNKHYNLYNKKQGSFSQPYIEIQLEGFEGLKDTSKINVKFTGNETNKVTTRALNVEESQKRIHLPTYQIYDFNGIYVSNDILPNEYFDIDITIPKEIKSDYPSETNAKSVIPIESVDDRQPTVIKIKLKNSKIKDAQKKINKVNSKEDLNDKKYDKKDVEQQRIKFKEFLDTLEAKTKIAFFAVLIIIILIVINLIKSK